MQVSVVAVVVVHDEPDYFAATIAALKNQSRSVDEIIVIDTSTNDECLKIAQVAGLRQIHRLSPQYSLPQSLAFAAKHFGTANWIWLLHDDSAPKPDALEKLLGAIETSPSVAIAGPKLLSWTNEKFIVQMGLTLTPLGALFSPVNKEIDQSQHDDSDDVMAVGTAAALIRADVFKQLGGFDQFAPELAADVDFSIRARMAGYRVIVVPQAKVLHAELALNGARERFWLGTKPKSALRRASIHLRLAYDPLPLALIFWILLPIIGALRAVSRIAQKRPDRIWLEISAAFWGFFTIGARFASRKSISRTREFSFSKLRSLRATWQQVISSNRAALEQEQSTATLVAFERGELEVERTEISKGFVSSGAIWIAGALVALSYVFWPANVAASGGGLLPLSESWFTLFSRAGASFQPIGLGYFAPSDPFVWVLTLLGGLTFWSPSLSLVLLLFFAKAIAFAGAWRLISLITISSFARAGSALVFAFWPALTLAQQEARIPAVIAQISLPWFIFALARAAGVGKASFSIQTWSWVAAAGLLFFIIAASAPNSVLILLIGLVLLMSIRYRKIGYLIWIPLPAAAIFGPTFIYFLLGVFEPFALLADPGLPQDSTVVKIWELILGGQSFGPTLPFIGQVSGWATAAALLIALGSLISSLKTSLWPLTITISIFSIFAIICAWFISHLSFAAVGVGTAFDSQDFVRGSPATLLAIQGLMISLMIAVTLSQLKKVAARRVLSTLLVMFSILPSAALLVLSVPNLRYADSRVVPSIIAAEAAQGSSLKTLVISPKENISGNIEFAAEIVSGDGVQLEDVSLSYRFALKDLKLNRAKDYEEIAQLVAELVSGNGANLKPTLNSAEVGYVLVPLLSSAAVSQLGIALDSARELESVGNTDFGKLWRVKEPNPKSVNSVQESSSFWSFTKGVQLAVLLGFVLLVIPTGNQKRRTSDKSTSRKSALGNTDSFGDASEDALEDPVTDMSGNSNPRDKEAN